MQYCIAWQGIDKCLGSTLGIYHTSDVVQVAQDVKAIKHPRQLSLEHCIGRRAFQSKSSVFIELPS